MTEARPGLIPTPWDPCGEDNRRRGRPENAMGFRIAGFAAKGRAEASCLRPEGLFCLTHRCRLKAKSRRSDGSRGRDPGSRRLSGAVAVEEFRGR